MIERCPVEELPRTCAQIVEVLRSVPAAISARDLFELMRRDYPELPLPLEVESARWRLQMLWFAGWLTKQRDRESGAEVYAIHPDAARVAIPEELP